MDTKTGEHSIPVDVLNDLCSRFIINVPEEERKDSIRILFQVELAHWFYLDFYCTDNSFQKLRPCSMKEFTLHIFQHIPSLRQYVSSLDDVIGTWREYKQNVPTYGAILLDTELTHVLLVQSYWARSSWGFPKGKVNQEEEPYRCAVREVLEETGFDISNLIDSNDFIEAQIHEQIVRLYVIDGISRNTRFEPMTRNEIKAVEWFPIADLPSNKKDLTPKVKMGVSPNSFFMVLPFIRRIKKWIYEKQQRQGQHNKRQRYKSLGDLDAQKFRYTAEQESSGGARPKKHSFTTVLQAEIDDLRQLQLSTGSKPSCGSPPRNGRKERKQNSKIRKPNNTSNQDGEKHRLNKNSNRKVSPSETPVFFASSWMNFKFDRQAIMDVLKF